MEIYNKTKKVVIAEDAKICDTPWSRAMGLRFKKRFQPMVFELSKPSRLTFDMYFVKFTIDVLFLRDGKVVDMKENVQPWTIFKPEEEFEVAIEIKGGKIKETGTKIGDSIQLKTEKNI